MASLNKCLHKTGGITIAIVLIAIVAPEVLVAEQATGVLYRVEGGLVRSAGGCFKVISGANTLFLNFRGGGYREPFERSGFTSGDSEQPGAIWRVWYHSEPTGRGGSELWLDRAVYTGHFDVSIRRANSTVIDFFKALASKRYGTVGRLATSRFRESESFAELISISRRGEFAKALDIGAINVSCTSVKLKRARAVSILADLSCFRADGGNSRLIQVELSENKWRIARVSDGGE